VHIFQVGHFAVDEIVSPMLEEFNKTGEPHLLDGLCSIVSGQSGRQLFQNMLPKLSRPPINSLALCRLAISSDSLSRNLSKVMDAMLCDNLQGPITPDDHIQTCLPVLFSVDEEEDVRTLLASLLRYASSGKKTTPMTAVTLLKEYIENAEVGIIN
jgi:hypothetical protein